MIPTFRVILLASIVSFASNWQFGYQITYINTASNDFYFLARYAHNAQKHCPNCTLNYETWTEKWAICVSSFYPGTFLGFIMVPFMMPRISLKSLITISCIPAMLGCIIQVFIRLMAKFGELPFYSSLIGGRFLIGFHSGISLCLLPIYFIETSLQSQRPFLSSLQQVFQAFSTLIGLICGSDVLFSLGAYKVEYLQLIGLLPTLFFFALLLKMPETPSRILAKSVLLNEHANQLFEKSAQFYMGQDMEIVEQFKIEAYERNEADTQITNKREILNRENLKGLAIGSIAAISFAFTGDDIIDSYSSQIIFRHTEGSSLNAEGITIILGVVLVIASVCGAFLMDKFGNRRLLIFGLVGTALSNLFASTGTLFGSASIVTVGFSLTKIFVGLGAGAPAWFQTSELVSSSVTSNCQAISTGLLLISVGILTSIYLPLETHLNELATLFLTSLPALLCALFMFLFLPETKQRRLDRIQAHLGRHLFSGLSRLPKDDLSRRTTITMCQKNTIHSYGSMGTMRVPSFSQSSAESPKSSMKLYNQHVF